MDRLVDLEMEADFVGKEALKKIKKELLEKYPTSAKTVHKPVDVEAHLKKIKEDL